MRHRRFLAALSLAGMLAAGSVGAALASHTHVKELGNGQCVVIADQGGEKWVVLPDAVFDSNPNVAPGTYAENRKHPLHVLVHLANVGNGGVHVLGSPGDLANCAGYVNP